MHISPEYANKSGAEVLRLSTEEYFKQIIDKSQRDKMSILCLRETVEELKKRLAIQEQDAKKENAEAISSIRKFWRNAVLEGGTHGGKMRQHYKDKTPYSK